MNITKDYVNKLFENLRLGEKDKFFEKVSDNVSWTVMGTHPLAGHYKSKQDFVGNTLLRINKILKGGISLQINNIFVSGDTAVVEMENISTLINGQPFRNTYCWIVRFVDGIIVEVRAYVDSALVKQALEENEKLL